MQAGRFHSSVASGTKFRRRSRGEQARRGRVRGVRSARDQRDQHASWDCHSATRANRRSSLSPGANVLMRIASWIVGASSNRLIRCVNRGLADAEQPRGRRVVRDRRARDELVELVRPSPGCARRGRRWVGWRLRRLPDRLCSRRVARERRGRGQARQAGESVAAGRRRACRTAVAGP